MPKVTQPRVTELGGESSLPSLKTHISLSPEMPKVTRAPSGGHLDSRSGAAERGERSPPLFSERLQNQDSSGSHVGPTCSTYVGTHSPTYSPKTPIVLYSSDPLCMLASPDREPFPPLVTW